MKRKINRVGNNTLTVSLPSKWAKKYGLKPYDELEVLEEGNTLRIETKKGSGRRSVSVNVSGLLPRLVDRFVVWCYLKGYDEVIIKYNSKETLNIIKNKVDELLGFEIIEREDGQCKIKMIAERLDFDFNVAFRKAFLILKEMAESCLSAYQADKKRELKELYLRDFEINQYCHFCLRELNKQFAGGLDSSILFYLTLIIEDTGDEYKELASRLTDIEPGNKAILSLLKDLTRLINLSYTFFYQPDKKTANDAYQMFKDIMAAVNCGANEKDCKKLIPSLMNIQNINNLMYHFPTMRLETIETIKKIS